MKPAVSDAVLNNPGIGFTTFQRFNGDSLNPGTGWTEGMPIEYQSPNTLRDPGYPATTIAYFRIYWRFLEPKQGQYDWSLIDKALATAHSRHQTLMLRVAPHGTRDTEDVPAWYRQQAGETLRADRPKTTWLSTTQKWMVDPEKAAYAESFSRLILNLAARYDGHPDLEAVDISILAAWGEGAGSELLSERTRRTLLDGYLEGFHRTPLLTQLGDPTTVAETLPGARNFGASTDPNAPLVGWRADCLGDLGEFSPNVNLMTDTYPEAIVGLGLRDAWRRAPVSMEACAVMQTWKNKGWSLREIMDQAIKWHVSSFNNKSSAVPEAWWPLVSEWLKHMGYRFALRRFAFNSVVDRSRQLRYQSWWENQGNAPVYRLYVVRLRLRRGDRSIDLPLAADVQRWMPGDNLLDGEVYLPADLPNGEYQMDIALTDPQTRQPAIHLASQGEQADGWLPLGTVRLATQP